MTKFENFSSTDELLEYGSETDERRRAREKRLLEIGFDDPSEEQRKANLALNIALKPWPKE
jgi:hypothetical protein